MVLSAIWDLPFGRGKHLGANARGVAGKLISGWQMNGIYQIQSGFPFSVKSNDVSGTRSSTFPRPNVIGDVHAPDPDPNRIFNRFAFAQQPAGTFGNAGRNILRGAGLNNLDLSFFKNTYVVEE